MCTAATYKTADFYFGRTLDYEFSYGDEVTVTPRNYPLTFRHASAVSTHYAIIGMAHVAGDYPLYYDAFNEKGLCMAGLNSSAMPPTRSRRRIMTTSHSLSSSPGFSASARP